MADTTPCTDRTPRCTQFATVRVAGMADDREEHSCRLRIESIERFVRPRNEVKWGKAWLRVPGTHIPGVIRYGSYGVGAGREFWATTREPDVVVIEATGNTWDIYDIVAPLVTSIAWADEPARTTTNPLNNNIVTTFFITNLLSL